MAFPAVFAHSTASRLRNGAFAAIIYVEKNGRTLKMREINQKKFGAFVSSRRKLLGMSQKDLAEKLFLSDKAVSKWERGLSLPDVSVLVPLAEALGVTVTELLEGETLQEEETLSSERVEQVVQKAIGLSEPTARGARFHKKYLPLWLAAAAAEGIELFLLLYIPAGNYMLASGLPVFLSLGILFGAYFCLFAPQRLPSYYDEQRISVYVDGIFQMNMPGVCFNNSNWGHILRACRIWSLLASTVSAPAYFLLTLLFKDALAADMILLIVFLAGLFVPIYYTAKKYGSRPA